MIGFIGLCNHPKIETQKDVCSTPHFINSRDYIFSVGDTISFWDSKFIPLDCDGNIKVLEYYTEGGLLSERYYMGEKVTKTVSVYDPNSTESHLDTSEYFKRIPIGIWKFYHEDGTDWKTINFSK